MRPVNFYRLLVLAAGLCFTAALAQSPPRAPAVPAPSVKPGPTNNDAVNFTPSVAELMLEEVPTTVTLFKRGPDYISVLAPPGWTAAGSAAEFYLTAVEFPQARITLRRSELPRPAALDEPWAQETLNLILRSLPPDSRRAVHGRKAMPIVINGWKSHELSVSFDQFGGRFVRGYIFVLTPRGELYELVTSAREQDYGQAREVGFGILTSWQEMTPALLAHLRSKRDAAGEMRAPPSR